MQMFLSIRPSFGFILGGWLAQAQQGPWPVTGLSCSRSLRSLLVPLIPELVRRQKGWYVCWDLASGTHRCNLFWREQHSISWRWGLAMRWVNPAGPCKLWGSSPKRQVVSWRPSSSTCLLAVTPLTEARASGRREELAFYMVTSAKFVSSWTTVSFTVLFSSNAWCSASRPSQQSSEMVINV